MVEKKNQQQQQKTGAACMSALPHGMNISIS